MGTYCACERDVFLSDSIPNSRWLRQEQENSRVLAYAIELTGEEQGEIHGNLYELDYSDHCQHVKNQELPSDTVKMIFERGELLVPNKTYFNICPDPSLGMCKRMEFLPDDPDALQLLLEEETYYRKLLPQGDFQEHIAALHDGLIQAEAQRIIEQMYRHSRPDTFDKRRYQVDISRAFADLASAEDIRKLGAMLPYQTSVFPHVDPKGGLYITIDKILK